MQQFSNHFKSATSISDSMLSMKMTFSHFFFFRDCNPVQEMQGVASSLQTDRPQPLPNWLNSQNSFLRNKKYPSCRENKFFFCFVFWLWHLVFCLPIAILICLWQAAAVVVVAVVGIAYSSRCILNTKELFLSFSKHRKYHIQLVWHQLGSPKFVAGCYMIRLPAGPSWKYRPATDGSVLSLLRPWREIGKGK